MTSSSYPFDSTTISSYLEAADDARHNSEHALVRAAPRGRRYVRWEQKGRFRGMMKMMMMVIIFF